MTNKVLPPIGTRIVRHVNLKEYPQGSVFLSLPGVDDVYKDTAKGTFMFRAMKSQTPLIEGFPWEAVEGDLGVVCFCEQDPPQDFVGFEITGHSKAGTCAFVTAVVGDKEELLRAAYNRLDQEGVEKITDIFEKSLVG
jgi:hypothetical protein